MDFWNKMVFPVRRVFLAITSRLKPQKSGVGLLKLHDDVQMCGYEDVQVMWEILQRTESEMLGSNNNNLNDHQPKRKHRLFPRVFVWSNQTTNHQ
ncbi:hypothetical protein CsatB_019232 [Cannabis sativa]|jgi:hypothetical protein|uniref:Uncharacterized protein n=2 Tax=Cannabis sativa TaxID=3483 RepID=A0AB40E4A1_CANSA|nr:uncharacterized protein LOC115698656 [Cannabis sativa]KAF4394701.1 hypothetical protein F8388_015607 [Cannabis sativa]KAF4396843.1 hypothetical protein F8388_004811 [Cannabis sativa]KAF4402939.1 hypothetical protein G4B88_010391 [Cannabis sativa]